VKPENNFTRRNMIKGLGLAASAPLLGVPLSTAAQPAPATRPASHRILSCNIRLPTAVDDSEGNGWDARKQMCAEIIRVRRPDLICLQECFRVQLEYLRSHLPGFDSFGQVEPTRPNEPLNAILFSRSRYALFSAGGFWLSEQPHVAGSKSWDSRYARFVNWVDLEDRQSGRRFRVWNTHLDHVGQVARERQAQLICEAADAFADDLPQILTGDFNANGSNPAIRLVKERGWVDTYSAVNGPVEPAFTFHAFWGPEYDAKASSGRIRGQIDWIFCRGPVKTLAAEVIRDGRGGRYPSDHYFMSADVAF